MRYDNVDFTDDTDMDSLMHAALLGGVGGSLRSDNAPLDWVFRAYEALQGTRFADRVSRAMATNLTAPEAEVRWQALIFFESHPHVPGAERIADLVAGDRAGFVGVPCPWGRSGDLEDKLVWDLAVQLRRGDERGIALARAEALRPGRALTVIRGLILVDDEWVDGHAEQIVRGSPDAGAALIAGLHDEGFDARALAQRVVPLCHREPEFDHWAGRLIDDPEIRTFVIDLAERCNQLDA